MMNLPDHEPADDDASLLDQILAASRQAPEPDDKPSPSSPLAPLIDRVMEGAKVTPGRLVESVERIVGELDRKIGDQLNAILHHPAFQALEARWRGLAKLVENESEDGPELQFKLLDLSGDELRRDIIESPSVEESVFFEKVFVEAFEGDEGSPFTLLIGDYAFDKSPEDLAILNGIAGAAAVANTTFLAGVSPGFLGIEGFRDLPPARDLSPLFRSPAFTKWRAFRESAPSRFVGLCLPRILLRLPYGQETNPVESFSFEEDAGPHHSENYLWGNAAFALAGRLAAGFASGRSFVPMGGDSEWGIVPDLPIHATRDVYGDAEAISPTETAFPASVFEALGGEGLIPLVHVRNTDYAAFPAVGSCHKPPKYQDETATVSALLASEIPYNLATSRLAQQLLLLLGKLSLDRMSDDALASRLDDWVSRFVDDRDSLDEEDRARRPLRRASIRVDRDPRTRARRLVAELWPGFPTDGPASRVRLSFDLGGG